ncbi:methenyltetrahydrofolate synthase domain-containing protein-like [Teleopsis dalmanni]|uniref:methenyltetrahydrofolate synthase domain-containing protein-like n=1 Tax=Teleopsis dalmanni TaxID=139649 RepID=UPI0018CD2F9A|nr:methenyltetrahydrofolate synthase domain-containing protein-like [Teleopsis dalmanni]
MSKEKYKKIKRDAKLLISKRQYRLKMWKKLEKNSFGPEITRIYNRVPDFHSNKKASKILTSTYEFKKAKNIYVEVEKSLRHAKVEVLKAKKNLYLPSKSETTILEKIVLPSDKKNLTLKDALRLEYSPKYHTDITLENKIELDMVIIGSVVVSREGYCIGRGNGYTDLNIGLLLECGMVTSKTIIVTVVSDMQVIEEISPILFKPYDIGVDIIVTRTQIIRVPQRLPRPSGIFWELLSEKRMNKTPCLHMIKKYLTKSGKEINFKEIDTDLKEDEHEYQKRKRHRKTKKAHTIRYHKSKNKDRKGRGRKYYIKLYNISSKVREWDLRDALRRRHIRPNGITWQGNYGKCVLYFTRSRYGRYTKNNMIRIANILKKLSFLVKRRCSCGNSKCKRIIVKNNIMHVKLYQYDANVKKLEIDSNSSESMSHSDKD